jgi:hypothetical protein
MNIEKLIRIVFEIMEKENQKALAHLVYKAIEGTRNGRLP